MQTRAFTRKSPHSGLYRYVLNSLTPTQPVNGEAREYLCDCLVRQRWRVLDDVQFWEDVVLDAVAQERDAVGMDQQPNDLLLRFARLTAAERRRLELDEDRLLCALLSNAVAFMVMLRVSVTAIRRKMRRLLGKCHIGLHYSAIVNQLLEHLEKLVRLLFFFFFFYSFVYSNAIFRLANFQVNQFSDSPRRM